MIANFKLGHRTNREKEGFIKGSLGGIAGQQSDADGCGVETEFSGDDWGRVKTRLKSAAFYFLNDGVEDEWSGVHHAAAEHDSLDVQQIYHARDARADVFSGSLDHHRREIVAFARFVGYVFGGEVFITESRER